MCPLRKILTKPFNPMWVRPFLTCNCEFPRFNRSVPIDDTRLCLNELMAEFDATPIPSPDLDLYDILPHYYGGFDEELQALMLRLHAYLELANQHKVYITGRRPQDFLRCVHFMNWMIKAAFSSSDRRWIMTGVCEWACFDITPLVPADLHPCAVNGCDNIDGGCNDIRGFGGGMYHWRKLSSTLPGERLGGCVCLWDHIDKCVIADNCFICNMKPYLSDIVATCGRNRPNCNLDGYPALLY